MLRKEFRVYSEEPLANGRSPREQYNLNKITWGGLQLVLALVILGVIVALLGVVFILQSKGRVGPSYSFMVNNPDWTPYGLITVLIGFVLVVSGLILS